MFRHLLEKMGDNHELTEEICMQKAKNLLTLLMRQYATILNFNVGYPINFDVICQKRKDSLNDFYEVGVFYKNYTLFISGTSNFKYLADVVMSSFIAHIGFSKCFCKNPYTGEELTLEQFVEITEK